MHRGPSLVLVSVQVPIVGNVRTATGVHTVSRRVPVVTVATCTFYPRKRQTLRTKYGRIVTGPCPLRGLGRAVRACL